MGRDRGGEKQWVRDLSEETARAGGEMEREEKATEGDRGRSGERRGGRGRYMGAKQEEDRESSPTVCRLPAAAAAHSWIVLPIRLRKEKEKGLRSLAPLPPHTHTSPP